MEKILPYCSVSVIGSYDMPNDQEWRTRILRRTRTRTHISPYPSARGPTRCNRELSSSLSPEAVVMWLIRVGAPDAFGSQLPQRGRAGSICDASPGLMREQLFLRILRTRAIGRLMEEVVIPLGQTLGYRCSVSGCRSDRSFSMISIIEHMKGHYAQIKDSKCHYNYQCKECERYFVLLGMTASCYCKRLNGTESNCLVTREDWSSSPARENVGFFNYVKQHAIAVFFMNDCNLSRSSSMAERAKDSGTSVANFPSAYSDKVPLTPLVCRDRERPPTTSQNLWSSYRSSLRDSVQTTAGSAQKEHHDRRCDRASRRPADRSPQWKSRQDALLLENPSPPLTPRRIARSPRGTPLRSPYHSPHHSPDHSQYDLSGSNYGWRSLTCSTPIRLPPHPYFQVGNGDQFAFRTTTSLSTAGLGAFLQHALLPTYRGFLPFLYPRCIPMFQRISEQYFCKTFL